MPRPALFLLATVAIAAALTAFVWPRGRERGPIADVAPLTSGASDDLFPLAHGDRRVRTFQCSGYLHGKMFFASGGAERLGVDDWVVLEIREQAYETSVAQTYGREWLRADERGVLCAQREEGTIKSRLEPPQRILELPLTQGHQWTWRGTAGGLPCVAESTAMGTEKLVLPYGTLDECWRVDTITTGPNGNRLERSLWFARGLGVVQEVSKIDVEGRTVSVVVKLEGVLDEAPAANKPRRRS